MYNVSNDSFIDIIRFCDLNNLVSSDFELATRNFLAESNNSVSFFAATKLFDAIAVTIASVSLNR